MILVFDYSQKTISIVSHRRRQSVGTEKLLKWIGLKQLIAHTQEINRNSIMERKVNSSIFSLMFSWIFIHVGVQILLGLWFPSLKLTYLSRSFIPFECISLPLTGLLSLGVGRMGPMK